ERSWGLRTCSSSSGRSSGPSLRASCTTGRAITGWGSAFWLVLRGRGRSFSCWRRRRSRGGREEGGGRREEGGGRRERGRGGGRGGKGGGEGGSEGGGRKRGHGRRWLGGSAGWVGVWVPGWRGGWWLAWRPGLGRGPACCRARYVVSRVSGAVLVLAWSVVV